MNGHESRTPDEGASSQDPDWRKDGCLIRELTLDPARERAGLGTGSSGNSASSSLAATPECSHFGPTRDRSVTDPRC